MSRFRISLLALVSTLLLTACGFRLAGYYDVPDELRQVELVIPGERPSDIRPFLNNLMTVNGIEVRDGADYRLEILNESIRRRTLTLTLGADAVEYELVGTARFSVFDRNGDPIIDDREVRTERAFNNDDNTTARDALEAQIRRDIQEQLAQQIVRQYLSLGNLR
jgi:LPS-assembly lipoprotein